MPNDPAAEYQLVGPSEEGNLLANKSKKESRQRLQALITEWLRMENLVVLTGAGTSVSSGGKTMAALERAVLETLRSIPNAPSSVNTILDERLNPTGDIPICGFETWLSYLVNGQFISSSPTSPFSGVQWKGVEAPTKSDLDWIIDKAKQSIFAECALALPTDIEAANSANEAPPHLAFLAKLVARDSNLGRTHLFTLNYDTLFEQACDLLGIQYFDGFTGKADARFDPATYGLDIYYPGEVAEGRVRRYDKFLHFYKLHGSIHWHQRNDELRARHPNLGPFRNYQKLTSLNKSTALTNLAAQVPPIGILPTANKFVQTLNMPYAHLFRALQIRLSVPQTFLLVLGYGFGDDHVTRILETALMNPSLVMLVVEPNPTSQTVERIRGYRELGKRAFVLTPTVGAHSASPYTLATFDAFSRTIMPDVQWLDDFLRLRRFEKQIQSADNLITNASSGSET